MGLSVARQRGAWVSMSPCAVPAAVAAPGMADLDEPDAPFRQPAGEQQLPAEVVRLSLADAVEVRHVLRLPEKSTTSGAASCMRAASSYASARAAMSELRA